MPTNLEIHSHTGPESQHAGTRFEHDNEIYLGHDQITVPFTLKEGRALRHQAAEEAIVREREIPKTELQVRYLDGLGTRIEGLRIEAQNDYELAG